MYCKSCGKRIDNDSTFCNFCGTSQIINEDYKNINIKSDINAKISPSFKFPFISKLVRNHTSIAMIYTLWILINLILLLSGSHYKKEGFWPNIYKTYDVTWHGDIIGQRIGEMSPEYYKIDWDLNYYGFVEFLFYVFLIPFLIFACYYFYRQYRIKHPHKPSLPDYSSGLRRF